MSKDQRERGTHGQKPGGASSSALLFLGVAGSKTTVFQPFVRAASDCRLLWWLGSAQDYLRKHPDCEVYQGQDETLDMKAIREQRKNPGLPNATYVNYLVDPESSQLYLQMNASSRRSRPAQPAPDGYGNEQYGYQQVCAPC